jgi:hypothetical protein
MKGEPRKHIVETERRNVMSLAAVRPRVTDKLSDMLGISPSVKPHQYRTPLPAWA